MGKKKICLRVIALAPCLRVSSLSACPANFRLASSNNHFSQFLEFNPSIHPSILLVLLLQRTLADAEAMTFFEILGYWDRFCKQNPFLPFRTPGWVSTRSSKRDSERADCIIVQSS